ncbi:hypothetical protein SAMN05444405_101199 [Bacteroides luti]|uniref:Uncharacterized protein n=1 Tax=Bacteroides luti TaxID=1297750 RepID=A0A1M4SUR9_9BACE|nr:hypothetical protein [Bacteroides luti]SHE35898.1 hypothetical protein SAMN05444405_101199 [Bacteroides luti]
MDEDILKLVSQISTPGFFVTTEIIQSSTESPKGIEAFILQKISNIKAGATGRKYAFRENGWQINFTFFPTNQVVDKRYGLMNKMIKEKKKVH